MFIIESIFHDTHTNLYSLRLIYAGYVFIAQIESNTALRIIQNVPNTVTRTRERLIEYQFNMIEPMVTRAIHELG